MDTIKLKSAEDYKDSYLDCQDFDDFNELIQSIQRNAIEYALQVASENAEADVNIIDTDAATDYNRMLETYENPIEVYVINSSITGLKETIFKDNNL